MADIATIPLRPRRRRVRRAVLWGALVLLLLVAQTLLLALTINYESSRLQEEAEGAATEGAHDLRRELTLAMQSLQALDGNDAALAGWQAGAKPLLQRLTGLARIERRDEERRVVAALESAQGALLFTRMPRDDFGAEADLACSLSRRAAAPTFSRSYFVPMPGGAGLEVLDLCVPVLSEGRAAGFSVATFVLGSLLEAVHAERRLRRFELSFVEGDGTRLARAGTSRGAGVYVAERVLDLPGTAMQLRADSVSGRPSLIPNLATALVLGLSVALFALVIVLVRDVRRRADAEAALAEALAFRKAMEDSLVTGLRARDLSGAITYVNPAFCAMVGFSADELRQKVPPYWPPEHVAEYTQRQSARLQSNPAAAPSSDAVVGSESVFARKNGDRFPVMIYEAALVDGQGEHTGWMSAVVDLSAQKNIEEISRQQQDRLQATARLATVGEMASLLSHELNQPLAAIASYASGSMNLLDAHEAHDAESSTMLRHALERIAEQAERAGRVIKSVHDFVRRREQQREAIGADALIAAVLPLVHLQARKSGTRIVVDVPVPAPRVVCDRTMLEQVLLNLTRNGIQAMESDTPLAERVLSVRVCQLNERWVSFHVSDAGPGIAPEVAQRLFTPFFTTKGEGMGLGLSLCRTVIEQHGGSLDFGPPGDSADSADSAAAPSGVEFRFTLAAAPALSASVAIGHAAS